MGRHHQGENLLRGFKFPRDLKLIPAVPQGNGSARGILVFRNYGGLEVGDGNPVIGQLVRIHLNPDLPLPATGDIHLQHPGNGLDVILEVISNFFQGFGAHIPGQGVYHNGHFRKVHLKDQGIVFQVCGQIVLGFVHLVLNPG